MSGAQNWSLKGIDPKLREAAREAAARQGMTLGEYLNHALASGGGAAQQQPQAQTPAQPRTPRLTRYNVNPPPADDEGEDWQVGGAQRGGTDSTRIAQRLESIERRTQLAVTGLDRAVSTIDRSVLGLAARIDDAEAASNEASTRIAEALEQFRAAGDTLSGKVEQVTGVKERLERQVAVAEEVARRADAATAYLTREIGDRDTAMSQTLSEARNVAEEAARQAAAASADAVAELRRLQTEMSERLAETESSTRRSIAAAVAEAANETRGTREALLEEVVRLEGEIAKRVGSVDQLKSEQGALIGRIERVEAGTRETTAGLRQAAGAAIADLRNAQLTLAARVKQVEEIAGASTGGASIDLSDLRQQQQDISERLAALESKDTSPVDEALNAFERRLAGIEASRGDGKVDAIDGAVKSLDQTLQRLTARLAETESTANTAIRTLEETVSSLGAKVEQAGGAQGTEEMRAMLEHKLEGMAQSVREDLAAQLTEALQGGDGVDGALADVNRRLAAAERRQAQTIEAISLEIKRMSETVDKRLRSVESRNDDAAASAVREELSRMAATLETRFDEIERREAAAFDRMGLEVGRLSERLEERVGAVETRSAQAIEHVGEQVARVADRFNQRQDQLARELGERMIDSEERAGQRVNEAINSMMQRLAEVEEHSVEAITPVQKAVSSVANKLEMFESARGAPGDEPVHHDAIPTPARRFDDFPMFGDIEAEPHVSPLEAAQPTRAAPLPPLTATETPPLTATSNEHDIYFAEEIDDLLEAEPEDEAPFTPPPEYKTADLSTDDLLVEDELGDFVETVSAPHVDDDPFWSPDTPLADAAPATPAPTAAADVPLGNMPELDDLAPIENLAALDLDVEPPLPPGKNDYLANARKAAQAQSQQTAKPAKKVREPKAARVKADTTGETPQLSLRGSSRVILWGTASLIAVALIGGAKYFGAHHGSPAPAAEPPPAAPQAVAPSASAPQDPFAEAPAEPVATDSTTAPTATAPASSAAPVAQNGATASPASAVVAGPLAPRAQSLEAAAQGGDLTAQYELALQRLAAGRSQEGATLLRRAADRGFAMAQYRLAKIYERGEGVPADLTIARQWTERAAAAGNRRAMHDLGVYFARGEGAPLDEAAAFRWFRQAAELGVADSQYNLGVLYQQGRGVNASASEALFWFLVAARQGDQDAGARATALQGQLAPSQVQQAQARAQSFRPRAGSAVANGEFGPRPWARPAA